MRTRLLARYGGDVVLSRSMPGDPPAEPWMPPNPPVIVTETVKFVSTAADTSLAAASTVLADDLVGMVQPPIGPLGEPMPGDMVRIDGTHNTLLPVAPVESEPGSVIHYRERRRLDGTDLLTRFDMAIAARALALRGEAVFLIRDRLIPIIDYDLWTRDGVPRAYRVSIPEIGGGRSETVLAAEVLHFKVAPDPGTPWTGQAPLWRVAMTAGLLHTLETALGEVYENAPLGSQIIPFPESQDVDLETLGAGFRGRRGRVLVRESVQVTAARGPAPAQDWRPQDATPDIQGSQAVQSLAETLPGLFRHALL